MLRWLPSSVVLHICKWLDVQSFCRLESVGQQLCSLLQSPKADRLFWRDQFISNRHALGLHFTASDVPVAASSGDTDKTETFRNAYRELRQWSFVPMADSLQPSVAGLGELRKLSSQLKRARCLMDQALAEPDQPEAKPLTQHHYLLRMNWDTVFFKLLGLNGECKQSAVRANAQFECDGRDFELELELSEHSDDEDDPEEEPHNDALVAPLKVHLNPGHGPVWSWEDPTCDLCKGVFAVGYLLSDGRVTMDRSHFSFAKWGSPGTETFRSRQGQCLVDDGIVSIVDGYVTQVQPLSIVFGMTLRRHFFRESTV